MHIPCSNFPHKPLQHMLLVAFPKRGSEKTGFLVPTLSKTTQYIPKTEASVRENADTCTNAIKHHFRRRITTAVAGPTRDEVLANGLCLILSACVEYAFCVDFDDSDFLTLEEKTRRLTR